MKKLIIALIISLLSLTSCVCVEEYSRPRHYYTLSPQIEIVVPHRHYYVNPPHPRYNTRPLPRRR